LERFSAELLYSAQNNRFDQCAVRPAFTLAMPFHSLCTISRIRLERFIDRIAEESHSFLRDLQLFWYLAAAPAMFATPPPSKKAPA